MTHTVIRIHDFSLISHLIHSQLSYLRHCATLSGFQLSISHTKNPVPQKPDPTISRKNLTKTDRLSLFIYFPTDCGWKWGTIREPPCAISIEIVAPLRASALVERARSRVEFLRHERPGLHWKNARLTVRSLTVLFKKSFIVRSQYKFVASNYTNLFLYVILCISCVLWCAFVASW